MTHIEEYIGKNINNPTNPTNKNLDKNLSFIELLKEPIIMKDYKNDIDNLFDSLNNIDNNYKYLFGVLMNKVFHSLGLCITKWDDDNIIYFTVPATYDSKCFTFNNSTQLAQYFKNFMTWCIDNGAGSSSDWIKLYGKINSITCKYKIRTGECWDKLKYITAKIIIIRELK